MFYIVSYENDDVSIIAQHESESVLREQLKMILLDFFMSKDIKSEYDALFTDSQEYYLMKNYNGSITLYQKITKKGYIYSSSDNKRLCTYYIKPISAPPVLTTIPKPPMIMADMFIHQRNKLKPLSANKSVEPEPEYNIITELLKNPRFSNIRKFTKPVQADMF